MALSFLYTLVDKYLFLISDQKFRSENSHQEKTDEHILIDLGPSKSDASDGCNKILSFRKRENAVVELRVRP